MTGFAALPNDIVRDPSIPIAEKGVLLVLAGFADKRDECWPTIDVIATAIGLKRRQTQNLLRRLRDRDLVSVIERSRESKPSLYRLKFNRWGQDNSTPVQDNAPPPCNVVHHPRATECTTPVHSSAPKQYQLNKTKEHIPSRPADSAGAEQVELLALPRQNKLSTDEKAAVEAWCRLVARPNSLPQPPLTKTGLIRNKALRSRVQAFVRRDRTRDMDAYFAGVAGLITDFHRGNNERGWVATIDWAIRAKTDAAIAAVQREGATAVDLDAEIAKALSSFGG